MRFLKWLSLPVIGMLLTLGIIYQSRVAGMTQPSAVRASASAPASLKAEGRVVTYPGSEVVVSTDVDGTIVRLLVKEKDVVQKGQLIAELRSDDLRAQIDEAKARVAEAESDIHLYEIEVKRAESLWEEKVGTRQAVDRAQRDVEGARARRDTAQASVRALEARLAKNLIYAPISGTIVERHIQQGETMKQGTPVVTIADLGRMRVEAEVDEFDGARIRLGLPVRVTAEGYEGSGWQGAVEEIPDAVTSRRLKPLDPGRPTDTRVLLVKCAFQQQTPLKLGQRVELEFDGK
jgi:RND family efflux transporter MFP subunit